MGHLCAERAAARGAVASASVARVLLCREQSGGREANAERGRGATRKYAERGEGRPLPALSSQSGKSLVRPQPGEPTTTATPAASPRPGPSFASRLWVSRA